MARLLALRHQRLGQLLTAGVSTSSNAAASTACCSVNDPSLLQSGLVDVGVAMKGANLSIAMGSQVPRVAVDVSREWSLKRGRSSSVSIRSQSNSRNSSMSSTKLSAVNGGCPAIDREDLTGDVLPGIGREQQRRALEVLGITEATQGDPGDKRLGAEAIE